MERPRLVGLAALCVVLGGWLLTTAHSKRDSVPGELVRASRESKTDLEVSWPGPGGVSGGFISYKSLLGLPQVTATVVSDENFTEMHAPSVRVNGVRLSVLARTLPVPTGAEVMVVVAADGYAAPYPAEYVRQHEPILVLTIDGMTLAEWAKATGNDDPGPYMVSYEGFVPAWHVLAHTDRPQVPTEAVKAEFKPQREVFGPITPGAEFREKGTVQDGFSIAKQNCLRCHNAGATGGTLAGRSWEVLARDARSDGAKFARRIREPKSVDAKAKMPGNPQYDAATLAALTDYFGAMQ